MKTFPTLYARTSTGATQIWFMELDGAKFRSTSGQIDGKKTVSEWTLTEVKNKGRANETSAEDQAEKEIEAKYKKQLKSGGYYESIEDIDKEQFFQPMLAKSYGDYADKIDWVKGVGVQIKYNGGRIVARKTGLFSRKGERYMSIPHIEEALKPFFNKYPNAILDGEGFNYDYREQLNEIMKLLRRTVHLTQEHFDRSKELIRFYVYDGFGFDGITDQDCYSERMAAICAQFHIPEASEFHMPDIIHPVPTFKVYSKEELDVRYRTFLDDKQEGAIIRIYSKPYEQKRSKYLLKYKPVDDAEYKVIAVNEGTGNWSGMAKTVTLQRIDGKKFKDGTDTFDATFKGTQDEAKKMLKEKDKYIGNVYTVYFFGYTGYLKPNYAQFDINNCSKS
jgi:ATP-dependent DNA ligase